MKTLKKWLTWFTNSSGTAVAGTTREPIAHPDAPPLAPLLTTRPRPRTGARAEVLRDMADGAEPHRLKHKTGNSKISVFTRNLVIFCHEKQINPD